ncbi:hypothetical protein BGZ80_000366 [Entomortierella chlamydospora]|uniref:Uncharacterized protein n=1 Tax=Entomortierella chlamydospora TaxID=101097 RepID=A0A9P6MTG8_9FUNG|nr:hypothetical protein BGZ79_003505 [Entomortierella chlamydospora]KAG0011880.1 hypothetical protein BGZ80_000366 [Entomortierella chlamydospora]
MDAKQPANNDNSHNSSSSKGKGLLSERAGSGSTAGAQTGGMTNFVESITSSARNVVSALDPRQANILTQHDSHGSSSSLSNSAASGSTSKASTSSASRTFQHATSALETIGSSSVSDPTLGSMQPTGFRSTPSTFQQMGDAASANAGGAMDWDSFLASSESTIQDDQPYNPSSMSSSRFMSIASPTEMFLPQAHEQRPQQAQQHDSHALEPIYQARMSQSMNLTPANHAAFLEYLKSTASSTTTSSLAQPSQVAESGWSGSSFSNDIQRQQQMDGGQVLAFLDSTSYSDFVDQIEAEGVEKHQQVRREFVYSEATLGPQTQSLFSTLQLIQHLPSERQDIVEYLMQQGTYSEDVWGRPFGHDTNREEAASLAATLAEQDQFLHQQQQQRSIGGSDGDDAMTAEMERVLKQIVDDAKKEVKTGETNGKSLNRLMMVRSHITMGTKL